MSGEALVRDKHLPTDLAVVALLLTVHLLMLVQLLLLVKTVATEPALEGFGPGVCAVVRLQVPLEGECLVTVQAAVALLPVVNLLVEHQAHQGGVVLPAAPALVGLLPVVGSLVGFHVRVLVETTVTLDTVDHLPPAVWGAATPHCVGELRVIFYRKETISESPSGWKKQSNSGS